MVLARHAIRPQGPKSQGDYMSAMVCMHARVLSWLFLFSRYHGHVKKGLWGGCFFAIRYAHEYIISFYFQFPLGLARLLFFICFYSPYLPFYNAVLSLVPGPLLELVQSLREHCHLMYIHLSWKGDSLVVVTPKSKGVLLSPFPSLILFLSHFRSLSLTFLPFALFIYIYIFPFALLLPLSFFLLISGDQEGTRGYNKCVFANMLALK